MANWLHQGDPKNVNLQQMVVEAKRELAMRIRVYPRLVEVQKMTMRDAQHQIAAQKAIIAELEGRSQPGLDLGT